MTKRKWLSALSVLFMTALLGGCGGGQVAGGGTGGTGMVAVRGKVESTNASATQSGVKTLAGASSAGVSSIKINGITYDMSQADYDGKAIEPGMVVTLVADNATTVRTAKSAFYMGELKGEIETVSGDINAGQLKMMGHTVFWDERTTLSPAEGFEPGASGWVEISGFSMDDGRIHATYIAEVDPAESEEEVVGFVSSDAVDSGSGTITFTINNVLDVRIGPGSGIDWSKFENFDVLMVKGTYDGPSSPRPVIEASEIRGIPNMGELGNGDKEAEVEGLVTGVQYVAGVPDPSSFFVAGQPVRLKTNTEYSGGVREDIGNGVLLEVEGPLKRDATTGAYYVEAEEVEFEDAIKIEAAVSSAAADALGFFGDRITVKVTQATESDQPFDDFKANDCVEIRARKKDNDYIATRIEREGDCDEVELQGPLEKVENEVMTILGVEIDTTPLGTGFTFEYNDSTVQRDTFFSLLLRGDIVSAEGKVENGSITWDKAEIED